MTNQLFSHVYSAAGKILLLALAYWLTGQLALLLAIPPGFVSAVFPPVGVALAAVLIWGYALLPGVFLGSTLLNLSIAVSSIEQLSWQHLLVATGIAFGTTIQCLSASWLIRRFVGFPNPLTEDRSIFLLLLLGGPLTCVLSASVGVSVLFTQQIVTAEQVLFSWWNWWVGDSIGVLLATPLMFVLFAKPREQWRSRISTVGLPLVFSCTLIVALFFYTSANELDRQKQRFHEQAKLIAQSIKSRIALHTSLVMPMERLFSASNHVTRSDFAIFVAPLVSDYPGIRAMSWNARVPLAQRPAYEASMLASGAGNFVITELKGPGQLVPAAQRPDYFPITYIEPWAQNSKVVGYDVGSESIRYSAMRIARDSARATLTAPVHLAQGRTGMLLFNPVYTTNEAPPSIAERGQSLRGYVVAVYDIVDVINSALVGYPTDSFRLDVHDISLAKVHPLYSSVNITSPAYANAMILRDEFEVAGRQFSIAIAPSVQFLNAHSSLQPWLVLAGGLFLCSLLGGFLLSVTGRSEQVRQLVRQRTLELSGILDNAAEAIVIFDANGQIDRANLAAEKLFGYSNSQLCALQLGQLLPALQPISPDLFVQWQGRVVEAVGQSASGTALELEVSLSSYELPNRNWYICLLHDISERKKVERLKQEFVATVSHELRTPLTSIKGSLELVNAGVLGEVPPPIATMLQLAQQNAVRLAELVNDILDIEKLEFGGAGLALEPLDLLNQLELAVKQNQGYADTFSVQLHLDLQKLPSKLIVSANAQRLQQVLSNLISNAVKFSEKGGLVKIVGSISGDEALIQVCDQGTGIPAEFQSRIFQKFAQADGSDTRQCGGTGLGLSISKELMTKMHGTIGFDSVEGKGSTFYITLPVVKSATE